MTDPTESPTPESLVLAEIRARHLYCERVGFCLRHGMQKPCDTAAALAAHDDRARAFTALAEQRQ